jgi:hypothetical protein
LARFAGAGGNPQGHRHQVTIPQGTPIRAPREAELLRDGCLRKEGNFDQALTQQRQGLRLRSRAQVSVQNITRDRQCHRQRWHPVGDGGGYPRCLDQPAGRIVFLHRIKRAIELSGLPERFHVGQGPVGQLGPQPVRRLPEPGSKSRDCVAGEMPLSGKFGSAAQRQGGQLRFEAEEQGMFLRCRPAAPTPQGRSKRTSQDRNSRDTAAPPGGVLLEQTRNTGRGGGGRGHRRMSLVAPGRPS